MRGHQEIPLKDGDEVDAFCARCMYRWKPGILKIIKNKFNRRLRKHGKKLANDPSGYQEATTRADSMGRPDY